jgi:archaellum biogenesis ATPase FlaH
LRRSTNSTAYLTKNSNTKREVIKLMQPYEVKLRKKYNLGNYETMDIEISAYITTEENPKEALTQLQRIINEWRTEISPKKP